MGSCLSCIFQPFRQSSHPKTVFQNYTIWGWKSPILGQNWTFEHPQLDICSCLSDNCSFLRSTFLTNDRSHCICRCRYVVVVSGSWSTCRLTCAPTQTLVRSVARSVSAASTRAFAAWRSTVLESTTLVCRRHDDSVTDLMVM